MRWGDVNVGWSSSRCVATRSTLVARDRGQDYGDGLRWCTESGIYARQTTEVRELASAWLSWTGTLWPGDGCTTLAARRTGTHADVVFDRQGFVFLFALIFDLLVPFDTVANPEVSPPVF